MSKRGDLKYHFCSKFKIYCALFSSSTGGREWCDGEGDPGRYEICPIPQKRAKANEKYKVNTLMCKCGHIDSPSSINKHEDKCWICGDTKFQVIEWEETCKELKIKNLSSQK